jgi:alkaline phosphatase D
VVVECDERLMPERTLLGETQERWLEDGLAASRARWNVIAQQTLMAPWKRSTRAGPGYWTDGWDGYPAARKRLLNTITTLHPRNPVVIGGDVHSTWVADLKPDFDDAGSPVVATEFCGTSITSQGPSSAQVEAALAANPHLRYGNGDLRGYLKVVLERTACRVELRALDDVKRADSGIATAATFVVGDGRPGARQV